MIVIATRFIPLTAIHCFHNGYNGKQPEAWKEYCADYWLKEFQESMDRCTGHCDITEMLLKTTLNIMQSIPNIYKFLMKLKNKSLKTLGGK